MRWPAVSGGAAGKDPSERLRDRRRRVVVVLVGLTVGVTFGPGRQAVARGSAALGRVRKRADFEKTSDWKKEKSDVAAPAPVRWTKNSHKLALLAS